MAVGSRSQDTCEAYADEYGVERRIVGYENVAADPDIDIVYVGTPGVFHHRDVMMCLEAGKHVICEKAMTINDGETADLIKLEKEKNRNICQRNQNNMLYRYYLNFHFVNIGGLY